MTVDRQLPLEPTVRIDPRTQVDRIPGHDAICTCDAERQSPRERPEDCLWPFCRWQDHIEQEDA